MDYADTLSSRAGGRRSVVAPRSRYLDLDILARVEAYSRTAEPDYFRSYTKHHTGYSFDNLEEYLGYLDYLHRGGVRR